MQSILSERVSLSLAMAEEGEFYKTKQNGMEGNKTTPLATYSGKGSGDGIRQGSEDLSLHSPQDSGCCPSVS